MRPRRTTVLGLPGGRGVFASLVLALASELAGCATATDRFEPASLTCNGEPCSDLAGSGGTLAATATVDVAEVDAGGEPATNSVDSDAVELEVQGAFSMDLAVRQPLSSGEIQAYPAFSEPIIVSAGVASIELSQEALGVWVFPPAGAGLRNTLNLIDVSAESLGSAIAINEGTLLDLTDSLALETRELEADESAAFVFFTDAAGGPLSGVSLVQSRGATVAYDLGIIYSDAIEATMERGVAVLLHLVSSVEAPDAETLQFQAVFAGEQYDVSIPVARGAISLNTVSLGETGP